MLDVLNNAVVILGAGNTPAIFLYIIDVTKFSTLMLDLEN